MRQHDDDFDEDPRERARRRLEQRTGGAHRANSAFLDRAATFIRHVISLFSETLQRVVDRFGTIPCLLAVAGVAFLLVLVVFLSHSCSDSEAPSTPVEEPSSEQTEPVQVEEQKLEPDTETLQTLLDADTAQSLIEAAAENEDVAWIAANPGAFSIDGVEVQCKLLKLAADEEQAVSFVREFPNEYPSESASASSEVTQGSVPRLYQWDKRWGYTVYSSAAFGLTGCCPTSFAMVYQGLTGKSDMSPYDMGVLAQQDGYMSQYNGTDAAFLVQEAPSLGLSCQELGVYADSLRWALDEGAVVICNVGPGDFTTDGHFFVITGLAEDGTLIINDPYSQVRSDMTWDIDQVINQTMALYAFWQL